MEKTARATFPFGPDDPLFPATRIEVGTSGHFEPAGFKRENWSNTSAVRRIFRQAFEAAGLPYFNPRCFRNTLAALGEKVCKGPEQFKAWSQNLAHESVLTTFTSYGAVARDRQADILNVLNRKGEGKDEASVANSGDAEMIQQFLAWKRKAS